MYEHLGPKLTLAICLGAIIFVLWFFVVGKALNRLFGLAINSERVILVLGCLLIINFVALHYSDTIETKFKEITEMKDPQQPQAPGAAESPASPAKP
jgi:hypothetical protein